MTATEDIILTVTERVALEELRKRISKDLDQNIYDETYTLYRFLKARNFDVNQAETMLRNCLQWRKQNNVDTLTTDYKAPEVLDKYFENLRFTFDIEGNPVYHIPIGTADVKGLLMSSKPAEIIKYFTWIFESAEKLLEKQSKKLNKKLGLKVICNIEGLTFANASDKKGIEVAIQIFKILQDNYPERLKLLYCINASSLFTIPFTILKAFVANTILEKVHILGTVGWKEELLKQIDENKLPVFLGGNMTDPDGNPLCKTLLSIGGKVDEKYYLKKSKASLSSQPDVKKLVLARASFTELPIEVKESGSLIEWEFETKTRDIGFGLFFKEVFGEEEKVTELISLQRLETAMYTETGVYKCEKSGTHIMLFDNSYSWIRSKEVYYRVAVVTPKEHEKQLDKKATNI